ncbi:hypothetical protein M5689_001572 [Euphorbia peplus]|nr:hypothetical protein M5689_001572 [Euphorbia peplus]
MTDLFLASEPVNTAAACNIRTHKNLVAPLLVQNIKSVSTLVLISRLELELPHNDDIFGYRHGSNATKLHAMFCVIPIGRRGFGKMPYQSSGMDEPWDMGNM